MLLTQKDPKETQIRFEMQINGEPVCDSTIIDRLWVTTQREAMIESGLTPTAPVAEQKNDIETQVV